MNGQGEDGRGGNGGQREGAKKIIWEKNGIRKQDCCTQRNERPNPTNAMRNQHTAAHRGESRGGGKREETRPAAHRWRSRRSPGWRHGPPPRSPWGAGPAASISRSNENIGPLRHSIWYPKTKQTKNHKNIDLKPIDSKKKKIQKNNRWGAFLGSQRETGVCAASSPPLADLWALPGFDHLSHKTDPWDHPRRRAVDGFPAKSRARIVALGPRQFPLGHPQPRLARFGSQTDLFVAIIEFFRYGAFPAHSKAYQA